MTAQTSSICHKVRKQTHAHAHTCTQTRTHINLLVKASQKKVAGTGGQTRGSKRTWAEMDEDEEADEGKQKWEEKWSSTDTMDNDTLRDMQDIFIYRVQERKMTPASFTNVFTF